MQPGPRSPTEVTRMRGDEIARACGRLPVELYEDPEAAEETLLALLSEARERQAAPQGARAR